MYYAKCIVNGIPSPEPEEDNCVLRVITLLLTADSKARAEIGLVKSGGHSSCRQCTVPGVYCNGNVYCDNLAMSGAGAVAARAEDLKITRYHNLDPTYAVILCIDIGCLCKLHH